MATHALAAVVKRVLKSEHQDLSNWKRMTAYECCFPAVSSSIWLHLNHRNRRSCTHAVWCRLAMKTNKAKPVIIPRIRLGPSPELLALFRLLLREPPVDHDFRTCPVCKRYGITGI